VRAGRVAPALQAHSQIVALCNWRVESTVAHGGEQARADRTRHAETGGSPSQTPSERAPFRGFRPCTPQPVDAQLLCCVPAQDARSTHSCHAASPHTGFDRHWGFR
jgi:hypothetical protein